MSEPVDVFLTATDSTAIPDIMPAVLLEELPQALRDACARAGWDTLMPVQAHALPYLLKGRDIMVQSRTGSGKTGTYLLPLLASLDPSIRAVQALVLVPTRELAVQVEREASVLFEGSGLDVLAIYGGVGYDKQIAALKRGVSLVVGTPGRILDHLMRRAMRLDTLRELIFDEADRMLSIGFYPDMKEIQRYLPDKPLHATLFSATYPPHVLRLAGEFLREPDILSLSGAQVHVAEVEHLFCQCKSMDKDRTLLRLIQVENPTSSIVFCNTKAAVHYVTSVLQGFGIEADELSADLPQHKREKVLERLRRGAVRVLVATDVAARGIDIPALSHVFLYEPPEDREAYIHRAGRTGRAGAAGTVVSLVDIMQKLELDRIAAHYRIPLREIPVPSEQDAAQALGQRVLTVMENAYRTLGSIAKERIAQLEPLAELLAADKEHLPILAMMIDAAAAKALNPDMPAPDTQKQEKKKKTKNRHRSAPESDNTGNNEGENRQNAEPRTHPEARNRADSNPETEHAPDTAPKQRRPRLRGKKPPTDGNRPLFDGIPEHLAAFIDPNGLDIPEGAEDDLPPSEPAFSRKPRRRRRRAKPSYDGQA